MLKTNGETQNNKTSVGISGRVSQYGGDDLLSLEVFKSGRVMTIHVEHHRRKGKVMPDECQIPS